jgi:hypothetical protein
MNFTFRYEVRIETLPRSLNVSVVFEVWFVMFWTAPRAPPKFVGGPSLPRRDLHGIDSTRSIIDHRRLPVCHSWRTIGSPCGVEDEKVVAGTEGP